MIKDHGQLLVEVAQAQPQPVAPHVTSMVYSFKLGKEISL